MRRSGWVLPIVAAMIWIATVGWPIVRFLLDLPNDQGGNVATHPPIQLLISSLGWAGVVAIGSMLLGWLPGKLLGRSLHTRGFAPMAALVFMPICLPAYMIYYAWWQSWPADTAIFRWLVQQNLMVQARQATLLLGLLCWSWPIVAWCVAGAAADRPAERDELMAIDGVGWVGRILDHLRTDLSGLLLGGLLVFLATINNTTCFDLSETFTYANELRAIQALDAGPLQIFQSGWPAIAMTATCAMAVWFLMGRRSPQSWVRVPSARLHWRVATVLIWVVSVLLPVALFARSVLGREGNARVLGEFFTLYRFSVVNTMTWAVISGLSAAIAAVGLAAAWQDRRRWVRFIATCMGASWLAFAAIPGTIIGVVLRMAYNHPGVGRIIYEQPVILIIGHLASLGFVAALMGRWIARQEPRPIQSLRSLDGAQTLTGLIRSAWPRLLAAGTAAFAIVFVLAIGEIPVTATINPPARAGHGPLSLTLLNDMHYQRPQTVMIAALGLFCCASLVAAIVAMAWRFILRGRQSMLASIAMVAFVLAGCSEEDPEQVQALDPSVVFGTAGQAMGQFNYPRAIDVDPVRKVVYVVDKSARVQRFDFDGHAQLQWHMPAMDNGKPTGVTVSPDGRVFVADTHYFRVIAYDPDGNKLMEFGSYGREPGQFIYVTDIAFGPQGRLYVSEYGGNDRVQVFDEQGNYLFQFGSFGLEPEQFNRPQSIVFNADKTQLFIADACNHRIDVYTPDGKFIRSMGQAGRGPGEFAYPYGITMLDDGTLVVAEFGNNRIQHLEQDGRCLGLLGGIGRGNGQLQYPWATAATHDKLFVLDSGNNRVQVIRKP